MHTFSKINTQGSIDKLCANFRSLDAFLGSPKFGLPMSIDKYWDNNKSIFYISKYFRNFAALDSFEKFINRLDEFWIAVDYFNGLILFQRKNGIKISTEYKDKFFILILIDSLRSSLDIYGKFLGWFFDLSSKEKIGFNYNYLIKPLKNYSIKLSENLNSIYKSDEFKKLKNYRDIEKHIGIGNHSINFVSNKQKFEFKIKRMEKASLNEIEKYSCVLLNRIIYLCDLTVSELKIYTLGYDAPNDRFAEEINDGFLNLIQSTNQ